VHCNCRVNCLLTFVCCEIGNRRVFYLICKTYEVMNPKRNLFIKVQVTNQDHKERLRGGACHMVALFRVSGVKGPRNTCNQNWKVAKSIVPFEN
jgi:hypothetical protein